MRLSPTLLSDVTACRIGKAFVSGLKVRELH
jgi:hypothetical protein